YLGLIRPDGTTVEFEFAPEYPEQVSDVSYGIRLGSTNLKLAVEAGPATAFVPPDNSLGTNWQALGFNDSGWSNGITAIGYEAATGYEGIINFDLQTNMFNANASAYVRIPFTVENPQLITAITLDMKFDDGFAAYINQRPVASSNAPAVLTWTSAATAVRADVDAVLFAPFSVTNFDGALVPGENILAVHALNVSSNDDDFLLAPEITATLQELAYFPAPTPGSNNTESVAPLAAPVDFSLESRTFTSPLMLTLTTPTSGGEIRYTTDHSIPNQSSTLYTGPIALNTSVIIRARTYAPGFSGSRVTAESFIELMPNTQSNLFSSDIPVIIVENFGAGAVPNKDSARQPAVWMIFEPDGAADRTVLDRMPEVVSRAGIKRRGSSTQNIPKTQFSLDSWADDSDDKRDVRPLGLASEADWTFYSPYSFDRAFIRNSFLNDLADDTDHIAMDWRFCEVFINTGGGALDYATDYFGVYMLSEKIERSGSRVDVMDMDPSDNTPPDVTGGWVWKDDRTGPGETGFAAGGLNFAYTSPQEDDVTPAQTAYIQQYINDFDTALDGPNFRDPVLGYRPYINVNNWVENWWLNVLPMNVDAFRLSAYYYKERNGVMKLGPVWDFDRTMGSYDGRDDNPEEWFGCGSTDFFNYGFFQRLFQDIDWEQAVIDKWYDLRQASFRDSNICDIIDDHSSIVEEASARHFARWPAVSPAGGAYSNEVNNMKNWLTTRAAWIDGQWTPPPDISANSSYVSTGFMFSITSPSNGVIYYTTDGSDPRAPGGGVSTNALVYTGPISVLSTSRIRTRIQLPSGDWSGINRANFSTQPPQIQ
ncbi:MAG: CotH kinase family protein, partial [Verrucomicrobiota bacterium]